jgi:hypothetical protein
MISKKSKTNKQCSHCNKPGHYNTDCWILHPEKRPDHWKNNKNKRNNDKPDDEIDKSAMITLHHVDDKDDAKNEKADVERLHTSSGSIVDPFGIEYVSTNPLKTNNANDRSNNQTTDANDRNDQSNKIPDRPEILNYTSSEENTITSMALKTHDTKESNEWYVDSGATQHMCSQRELFEDYQDISTSPVCLADGRSIPVKGKGTINLGIETDQNVRKIYMKDVLYVPDLRGGLISVKKTVEVGNEVIFGKNGCKIVDANGKTIAMAVPGQDLYRLKSVKTSHQAQIANQENTI